MTEESDYEYRIIETGVGEFVGQMRNKKSGSDFYDCLPSGPRRSSLAEAKNDIGEAMYEIKRKKIVRVHPYP